MAKYDTRYKDVEGETVASLIDSKGKEVTGGLTAEQMLVLAKQEIDDSSASWVDKKMTWWYKLLLTVGALKEAEELDKYYNKVWGDGDDE